MHTLTLKKQKILTIDFLKGKKNCPDDHSTEMDKVIIIFFFTFESSIRFGPSLRYIELPIELITHTVLHELSGKCPNLTHMLLDFSTAMQLHDFNELQV